MRWWEYLICFVVIGVGAFCGLQLYKEIKAESYVNGTIDISNRFSQDNFYFADTTVAFYDDLYDETENFTFTKDLIKVNDFDGNKNEYQVFINDYIVMNCDIKAGSIYATITIDFYDTNGDLICSSPMQVSIKFLSNKTQLTLITEGQENASFLEQYCTDNGIKLKVIEIL